MKPPRKPPGTSGPKTGPARFDAKKPIAKSPSPGQKRVFKSPVPVLSNDTLLAFLEDHHGKANRDEIIAHFALSGQQHVALRHMLQDLADQGVLQKETKQFVALADTHPSRATTSVSTSFSGIFNSQRRGGGIIKSTHRKDKTSIAVNENDTLDAKDGDLVEVVNNKVTRILASRGDAGFVSLLAIRNFDVPDTFPPEVIAATDGLTVPDLGKRTDLRNLSLVTIDGEDARDFDDAVHATLDDAPDNTGGWVITVAIADVSHYVRPGNALDVEALKRGNSLYFPDRVVPMLPEALSNNLCSLRPHEPRACLAIIMRINRNGHLIDQKIVRGLMQSVARLTYNQVQEALDGKTDELTKPILADIIMPLYGAYKILLKAREERGTIDLDVPERKIELRNGVVYAIHRRERFESHKLIEEMMILANVAAATLLEDKHQSLLYRAHGKPDPVRLENTRNFLKEFGYRLKTGMGVTSKDFRTILQQSSGHDEAPLINDIMLRTMSQAEYSPFNVGHFGLALERYAHFTSPIRRYADLIVHRALIKAYKLGDDGLTEKEQNALPQIATHISERERIAQSAERETVDRYVALYLQDKVGQIFEGRISGVTSAGLFITLDDTGADGLLPMRLLPRDFFVHDEQRHMLVGQRTGQTFRLAGRVRVELLETDSITGRLVLQLAGSDPNAEPTPRFRRETMGRPRDDARRDERPARDARSDDRPRPQHNENFNNGERRLQERERDAARDAHRAATGTTRIPGQRNDRPLPPKDGKALGRHKSNVAGQKFANRDERVPSGERSDDRPSGAPKPRSGSGWAKSGPPRSGTKPPGFGKKPR